MLRVSIFEEKHVNQTIHYHFPILAEWPWACLALARRLRQYGIYVNFSNDHQYYWTALVYLAVPSDMPDGKREMDLDPKPWLCAGHPTIREALEDMPRGGRQSDKNRVRRYLGVVHPGSDHKDVALSDKQFNMAIIKKGLRNLTAVLGWVQARSEEEKHMTVDERMEIVGMEAFCLRNQHDLGRRIAFAWDLHDAPRNIALQEQSAWEAILATRTWKCVCSGQWILRTEELLGMHIRLIPFYLWTEAPRSLVVRRALRRCLQQGCKKFTNVFLYEPKTLGKSHVAKPLIKIFQGRVFLRPAGVASFPLQQIFGKKVCVLQDIRIDTFKLSFDSLLVWWEGESFPVPMPQNRHDGDRLYAESAPVIATSGDKLRIAAHEAQRLQLCPDKQNSTLDDRFVYFHFPRTFLKKEVVEVEPCGRCFAEWVCDDSPVPSAAAPTTSYASSSAAASCPSPSAPPVPTDPAQNSAISFVALLEKLERLHASGGLNDVEFVAAKHKLLELS